MPRRHAVATSDMVTSHLVQRSEANEKRQNSRLQRNEPPMWSVRTQFLLATTVAFCLGVTVTENQPYFRIGKPTGFGLVARNVLSVPMFSSLDSSTCSSSTCFSATPFFHSSSSTSHCLFSRSARISSITASSVCLLKLELKPSRFKPSWKHQYSC